MKHKIFFKLLVIYLAIAFFVTLSLNFLLAWYFHEYFYRQYRQNLFLAVKQIQDMTLRYQRNEISGLNWLHAITLIEQSLGVHLIIIDNRNNLAAGSRGELKLLDLAAVKNFLEKTRQGQTVTGTIKNQRDPAINIFLVSAPLGTSSGEGIVIAHTPVADINKPLNEALKTIWLASLLVLTCATPVLYLLSKHFTQPLRLMHAAALKIAGGDFGQEINLTRRDEIGELAGALNEMAEKLDRTEKTRQELLANVSHELRTPLTSISGFVQGMLDETIPPADYQLYLSRVYGETQRLIRIVSDLMDIARMRAGKLDFQWEMVNIEEVCREAADCLNLAIKEKGIDLKTFFTDGFSQVLIYGDRCRLMQVFLNVLDNAVRYTPVQGEVLLHGEMFPDWVCISIQDGGPGIPENEIPYIFDRYYQGSSKKTFSGNGMGLGLAISKLLIEAHHGKIEALNLETDKGTIFKIWLPLRPAKPGA